eukprot:scaffold23985_cov20-Tisochrysis_lutea.AAC.3
MQALGQMCTAEPTWRVGRDEVLAGGSALGSALAGACMWNAASVTLVYVSCQLRCSLAWTCTPWHALGFKAWLV